MFVTVGQRLEQGDFGEMSAMQWLASRGATIAVPVGHSRDWDLVAELDGTLLRVQVKTSSFRRKGRWETTLCTRGGNRSWSGVVKRLDPARFEFLYVHVGDGRRWFIPAAQVEAGNTLLLGGPKYARFEIGRGDPLPAFQGDDASARATTDTRVRAL
jgi:hypothetical protein